jgi:hypothetical protein
MSFDALVSLVIVLLLGYLVWWPLRTTWTDFARHIVFEKRDSIFDLASAGRLDFRSKEYRTIRLSLETAIRFAHEATIPRLLVMGAWLKWKGDNIEKSRLAEAIQAIDDDSTREEVGKLVFEAYRVQIIMMFAKSPIVFLLGLCTAVIIHFSGGVKALADAINRAGETIQVEAESSQQPDSGLSKAA